MHLLIRHNAKIMQTSAMEACFQIAECSFAFAKILQKEEITKRIVTFFILSPIFSCEIKIFFSKSLEIK